MSKYLLLYVGGNTPAGEEEGRAIMQAWMDWFGRLGPAVVDAGNPFNSDVRSLNSDGRVSNGAIGVPATGYSIVEAASLDAAVAMAKTCPQLRSGGQISVYETYNVM